MAEHNKTFFAPHLYIQSGITDLGFYKDAFDAVELRRFTNDDGTVHVAELEIDGSIFHVHEENLTSHTLSPFTSGDTTNSIGMFVPDVDTIMNTALAAGAKLISPAQDYDYGYRQGIIEDPFGHHWLIESKV